jgi:hypothetical protein
LVARIKGKLIVDNNLKTDQVLRRYLDTSKFLSLISKKKFHLCRGDKFQDKFEGAFTKSIKNAIDEAYRNSNIEYDFEKFKKELREGVYINCWHQDIDDNMAMWELYGKSKCSVAITTTVEKLNDAILEKKHPYYIAIKEVEYVKHWKNPNLDIKPYSNVFSYKNNAYKHEQEVRVIVDRLEENFEKNLDEKGMYLDINLNKLLRSIVLAPDAPDWYHELIINVTKKYDINAPIRQSKLSFGPE